LDKPNSTIPSGFDPVQHKINTKTNWNAVAFKYHKNWASTDTGPFKSTKKLVKSAQINPNDIVLDLACGTGAVSNEIVRAMGKTIGVNKGVGGVGAKGLIIGVDISRTALSIAKSPTPPKFVRLMLIEMDAENLGFRKSFFSKILCQFGLMFFPNPLSVLKVLKEILMKGGKLSVAVHGSPKGVPYFSCIMDCILKYIPNIRPNNSPSVHTFGNPGDLFNTLENAGLSGISIKKYTFCYQAGTFEDYWSDYMSSTANSIRHLIESKGDGTISSIKKESKETSDRYADHKGIITFPWDVFIATAYNNNNNNNNNNN
jgi:ubiquinone/menaquinone biosynthesis C-methylase UbiE